MTDEQAQQIIELLVGMKLTLQMILIATGATFGAIVGSCFGKR